MKYVWEEETEGKTKRNRYIEKSHKALWKKREECLVIMEVFCCLPVCREILMEECVCVYTHSSPDTVLSCSC